MIVRRTSRARLGLETLEGREVPSVTLRTPPDTELPNNVPLFLPVTTTSTPAGNLQISATSSNAAVTADVVTGGRTLKLDVTGTDAAGVAFSGTLTLRLFEDVAPKATGTLISLANSGFYDGKLFHRVIDNFVIQGGSPNGDGLGGSTLPDVADEFNRDFTFASQGIVAMANAGDDNNNSQFFITDIDRTLSQRPQNLNFNHSIVGLLTSGFDTYQKIATTRTNSSDKPLQNVTITKATVITDMANGVVRIRAAAGATGAAAVTVSVDDGTGPTTETLNLNVTPNVNNNRAFLNAVTNPTIAANAPGSFTLGGTDTENDALTFAVGVPGNLFGQPANASAIVDAGGKVTVTPVAGFTGTIDLLVGVRDQTNRGSSLSDAGNFDTQRITVTVQNPATSSVALAVSQMTVRPNASVVLTATVTASSTANGTVQFFADGTQVGASAVDGSGQARFTTTFAAVGPKAITARFSSSDGTVSESTSAPSTVTVSADAPATVALAATGSASGTEPRVRVTNADGTERFNFLAFEGTFTGGVRVATADFNRDGQDDIVAVPGFGGSPLIHIYDGVTGALVREVMVFEPTFRGGLYVSVGDAQKLGYAQILVGAGFTGGPRVSLFDNVQNKVTLNYFAYDETLRSGVSVSLSDLAGNGTQQIITGPGRGAGPVVKVANPVPASGTVPTQIGQFFAGDAASRTGIRVGAGGIVNSKRNILVGPFEPDASPLDQSFDPVANGIFVG